MGLQGGSNRYVKGKYDEGRQENVVQKSWAMGKSNDQDSTISR